MVRLILFTSAESGGGGDRDRSVNVQDFGTSSSPRDSLRVKRLYVLPRPDGSALDREQLLTPRVDDAVHGDPVDDGADEGARDLRDEAGARRQLGVVRQLQVAHHPDALHQRVGPVQHEHHVGHGPPRHDVRTDHLDGRHRLVVEARQPKHAAVDERQEPGDDDRHQERPPRQARVLLVAADEPDDGREDQDRVVPPVRRLFVRASATNPGGSQSLCSKHAQHTPGSQRHILSV